MNKQLPKCDEYDYINFLVASQKVYSCTEAARVQPHTAQPPAHDSFTRLLRELKPDPAKLWQEAAPLVKPGGLLILDDTTLDKPYARKMALVTRHWSGKHRQVVNGINLLTLLWSDGASYIPCDYRLYDKVNDGLSKNDHLQQMVEAAAERGLQPQYVCFDSWYASLANLKAVRAQGWRWLTRLKGNRQVDPDGAGNRAISEIEIGPDGQRTHLRGYGWIKVFKLVAPDGDIEYWATNDEQLSAEQWQELRHEVWKIEQYHRGLKQHCGVEAGQMRDAVRQRNHIGMAIRAFLRLEVARLRSGQSWFESKIGIVREAVRAYLANPAYTLLPTIVHDA